MLADQENNVFDSLSAGVKDSVKSIYNEIAL